MALCDSLPGQGENRRFVLSFRSKDCYSDTYREELLCDKNTGEILIRTKSNDIVSYDSASRYKEHVEYFTNNVVMYGFHGGVFSINNTTTNILPHSFDENDNILDDTVTISTSLTLLYLSIDSDHVIINNTKQSSLDIDVTTSFNVIIDLFQNTEYVVTKEFTIGASSDGVINLKGYTYNNIIIKSISINGPGKTDGFRTIVHSILCAVSKNA